MSDSLPLLVYGPLSPTYDFGPAHPLTPRRFGPSIELLASLGAEPGLAPEPAPDEDLLLAHSRHYISTVEHWSSGLDGDWHAGIGPGGDNPAFPEMHEAGAMVAGGSMRAMEAILRGDVAHAFHPGGGLHHAMRDRAAGFCIYDDPALAIALARRAGLRVLYVDLDVHHGDGVQAIHWSDPGVLTVSFHETGRYLFPGTGFIPEVGEGPAAGTSINIPFEPGTGERAWLAAVESVLPAVAAAFGPDIVVSQHGCDTHAWDPLAHLRVTTTAMGAAARLVDRVAHRWAGGRWLATGGGGYDAYRVVPRAWSLVWLAGAHREAPSTTPEAWRERWAAEAARYGQAPLPESFDDAPNAGEPIDGQQREAEDESLARLGLILGVAAPAILRQAILREWLDPLEAPGGPVGPEPEPPDPSVEPTIVALSPEVLDSLALASRVIAPADPAQGRLLLMRALRDGEPGNRPAAVAAVVGDVIVGLAVEGMSERDDGSPLLALGVAPAFRRRGIATALLRTLVESPGDRHALVTVAERDPFDPLDHAVRVTIARRLLERAGFAVGAAGGNIGRVDPAALSARMRH
jgi:acetoin utilization protein AcuC